MLQVNFPSILYPFIMSISSERHGSSLSAARATLAPEDQWYAVHVLSGQERRVSERLNRLIQTEELGQLVFQTLVPMEKIEEVKKGKKIITERKLFPGYVYINMHLLNEGNIVNNELWYKILGVEGIIGFASGRRDPRPIRMKEVEALLRQVEAGQAQARLKVEFNVGDYVNVLEGPFEGQEGLVEEIDPERGKLRVGVSIFGRTTPVDLEYTQVKHAEKDGAR